MSSLAVDIQALTHRYGTRTALHDVSLAVSTGTLFGLLGPNGGGKTTLFRILSTLLRPSEGTAQVFGLDAAAQPGAVRQRLGVVFQQTALDDALTVRENLQVHGALYGLRGGPLRDRIATLLDGFELTDRAGDKVEALSGGLQRRVDLARGLLHRPGLLLLDEPTTGLDPVARHTFWQLLHRLRREEGTTMMLATHLLEEAEACEQVGILDQGRLVALGTPGDLKQALGGETLWLESDQPSALRDLLTDRMALDARVIGGAVQVTHDDAPALLGRLYEAFGDHITSATVRRPTLEDVFMVHAGRPMDAAPAVLEG